MYLNQFFSSVFTIEDPIIPEPTNLNVAQQLTDVELPAMIIHEKICSLEKSSAFGPDRIGTRLLQEGVDVLCVPMSIIFERSLREGVVPSDWRQAHVTPIFKGGSKMQPGNYRPVSLTCIVCNTR